MRDVSVGQLVYLHYTPRRAGKVIAVHAKQGVGLYENGGLRPDDVSVKWLDGSVSVVCELAVTDFKKLIADHEKKLAAHRATLARLEAL